MRSKFGGWAHFAHISILTLVPATARAAEGAPGGDSALWVTGALALCATGAVVYYRHRMSIAEARCRDLADEAKRHSEILTSGNDQFLCWDLVHGIEEASPGLAAFLGGASDDVGYAEIADLLSPANRAELDSAIQLLRTNGEIFELSMKEEKGDRTLELRGVASGGDTSAGPSAAVLWIRDDTANAERTAKLSGERAGLGRILDILPMPVWHRGPDSALEYVNSAYAAAVGKDAAAAPGSLPELAPAILAKERRATGDGQTPPDDTTSARHVVIGGARRYAQFTERRLDEDGRVAGYALDLTEIEEVRAELSRHIGGHEEVLQQLGTAVAIYSADQRLNFFNNAFLKLWELDENWLRAEPPMGEVLEALRDNRRLPEVANFPAFKEEQLRQFTELMDPFEELIYLPDGPTYRAVVTPHPFGGLLLTWEDVSDTLALERSYNTLIAVQRETLDNLYEGIAVIGADGRLQLSNPAFGRMWQLPEEELVASPHISDLVERMREFIEEDGDWAAQREEIIALLTGREGYTGRVERSDGSVLDFATVPLPDGAVLLSYLDVSDSNRVERALRERNDALETADRLKSEFIANVSYELRTPLNTIIGFSEILTGQYFGELNDRQTEYSRGILESSNTLLSLINDILDLASVEAGHMMLELEPVNLHDLLSSVLTLTRERMRKKRLFLDFDCPLDIGAIVADERRLKQALFNIMSNSVKFTPEDGSITVSARRTDGRVTLTFTDTGIGITETDRSRVFERFERGDNAEARRTGVGLGLSLVKSFVELHGGTVELESESGVGTKVTCVLPAREIEDFNELRIGTG